MRKRVTSAVSKIQLVWKYYGTGRLGGERGGGRRDGGGGGALAYLLYIWQNTLVLSKRTGDRATTRLTFIAPSLCFWYRSLASPHPYSPQRKNKQTQLRVWVPLLREQRYHQWGINGAQLISLSPSPSLPSSLSLSLLPSPPLSLSRSLHLSLLLSPSLCC